MKVGKYIVTGWTRWNLWTWLSGGIEIFSGIGILITFGPFCVSIDKQEWVASTPAAQGKDE